MSFFDNTISNSMTQTYKIYFNIYNLYLSMNMRELYDLIKYLIFNVLCIL